jgi:hypothetical protein
MAFERDSEHWLLRFSPREWIALALKELARAEAAFARREVRAAYAGLKRAAGMALNAALIESPNEAWGRTYVEHVAALARDASAPAAAAEAAERLAKLAPSSGDVVSLRTRSEERALVEAAKTVMAHAYAIAFGSAGESSP